MTGQTGSAVTNQAAKIRPMYCTKTSEWHRTLGCGNRPTDSLAVT